MEKIEKSPKRFYRSRTQKMIGGVCGGLAEYLNVDVVIVRILALVLLFCGSLGFWAYLVFWIVAPLEPRATINR